MIYTLDNNKIIITNKKDFNIKHILECGQIFSYKKINENCYEVYSANKKCKIVKSSNGYVIESLNIKYFVDFFDLNTNYAEIKKLLLKQHPFMKKIIKYGEGIRILKQDIFETIISFIISANNNIKRIQKILFALREKFGTNMGLYNAFPTIDQLENVSIETFQSLGLGYRSKYVFNAVKQLKNVNLEQLKSLTTQELNSFLLSIMGIGQKVADCIMLFAFSKQDVFPVDTWIEKVYCCYFEKQTNRKIIREALLKEFGDYSGYAQQYLFYSQRELSLNK